MDLKKGKIILIDFLCPKGHVKFNQNYISHLLLDYDVIFIGKKGYLDEEFVKSNKFEIIELNPSYYGSRYKFWFYFKSILNIWRIAFILIKISKGNRVIISSYIEYLLVLCPVFKPSYLINHNNIDRFLHNFISRYSSKLLNRKHTFVYLNPNSKSTLKGVGISNLKYWSHGYEDLNNSINPAKKYIFIPSANNIDHSLLERTLNSTEIENWVKSKGFQVVIKNNTFRSHKELIISKDYFTRKEYDHYFSNACMILLFYDSRFFVHRVSGIIYEAIALNIPFFYPSNNNFDYLKQALNYNPEFDNELDLLNKMKKIENLRISNPNSLQFKVDFSD